MPKRYQNVGTQPILDNRMPGATWDGVVPEGQETFLLGIGALKIISHDVEADKRISALQKTSKSASKKKG